MKIKSFTILLCLMPLMAFAQVQKVAILETVDKEGNISYACKLMVRSNLAKAITNAPGYEAYDRTDMDAIMGEQNFQRTGLVSNEQIKRLGEMTGAAFILVAEAAKVDEQTVFITAKILNVETAKTEMTDNALMGVSPSDIQHGCESLANKLLGLNPTNTSSSLPTTPARPAAAMPQKQSMPQPTVPAETFTTGGAQTDVIGELCTFYDGTQGIVFYKTTDGHGLAVSLEEGAAKWQDVARSKDCQDIILLPNESGTKAMTYLYGMKNTNVLLQQLGYQAAAAIWCSQRGEGWYLPSAGELWYLLAIANKGSERKGKNADLRMSPVNMALVSIGGTPISDGWYWSSTENDNDEAINVSTKGSMSSEDKTTTLLVRAIRAF